MLAIYYADKDAVKYQLHAPDGRTPDSELYQFLPGKFALLHRKNNLDNFLPLDFKIRPEAWSQLKSRFDAVTGKYLIFFSKVHFDPRSWAPFDAWWFDPQNETLEHIILPVGPWVEEDSLLKQVNCFSAGCGTYRSYDIKVGGNRIFISISGKDFAIDSTKQGLYEYNTAHDHWDKVSHKNASLSQISPDGCKRAVPKETYVEVIDICHGGSWLP